ncbi:ABC transporter substrate-binding protein [Spirochaeta isovalerica]|uniref:Multiple sugar transport system substrate-binding protein/raffinose/stachyose/melibiose transport system substrate-binding protein n=1 Tax=Spirochaeta isovalerica TaxID=150 RepID=A0A841R1B4_9SPIO|nr:ABC transporter substrate-binding protein [Spirochaeta isovalerica]MBB6478764.1 multiple sugar transport system substrate-binding protein/raffinose/stachyose/melibiose transport system substrate-binding protein [Spirochaeta isovalerica]
MIKKVMGMFFVLLFVLTALPVFAGGAQEESSGDSANIVIYNSMNGDPKPRAADEELVGMFEAANPGTTVVHSIVAHEDFKQAIRAYLSASTPPDVLTWFAGNRARFFIDKGLIMDISDVWEEQGWNDSYPKGFRAMSSVDGKQYFLPTSWYWWGVYYRPSVFEKYNIEVPETWDDLMVVCETLKSNGVTPFTIGTKYRWTAAAWFDYFNMRINGPEFHINLMLGKESYTDPRVKDVFVKWAEMIDKGYFIENPAAYAWAEAIPFMANESAAMYLMGDFIRDSFPEELLSDLDFFRFPIIDPSVPVGEDAPTDGYFIPAKSKNPEGAKALLAFFGSKESQEYTARTLDRLNTNSDVDISIFKESQQKGIKMINEADFVAQFYDRDTTPEMADAGMNGFMEFWENHSSSDIDKILENLERVRQEAFAE